MPSVLNIGRLTKILFTFKKAGIFKEISYERRTYESVDEKSLSYAMSRKTTKKKKYGHKLVKENDFFFFKFLYLISAQRPQYSTFEQSFNFNLRWDPQRKQIL